MRKTISITTSVAALSLAMSVSAFAAPFTAEFVGYADGHDLTMNIHQTGNVTYTNVGSKVVFTAPEGGFPTQPVGVELVVDGTSTCKYSLLCTKPYNKDGKLMQGCGLQAQNYKAGPTEIIKGTIDYGVDKGCVLNITVSKNDKGDLVCSAVKTKY